MIICKEFKNSYHEIGVPSEFYRQSDTMETEEWLKILKVEKNKRKPVVKAQFLDEASGGEPWGSFTKWFVDEFYAGPSMMETIFVATRGGDTSKLQQFQEKVFTTENFEEVKRKMDETGYADGQNTPEVLEFLQKCIGNHISTENW